MFGFFKKDPLKKMEKEYRQKLEKARDIQRSGDVKKAALMYDEAEKIADQMDIIRKKNQ